MLLQKALSVPLSARRRTGGLPAATSAPAGAEGEDKEESGCWHYLVTDSAGIRPRLDSCYNKESKRNAHRLKVGTVVEINRRRRSGWTKWLHLASGEGWLFDISPKDRKVRLIEVEVQQGEWDYEVCVHQLAVMLRPIMGTSSSAGSCTPLLRGLEVKAVERVRPLVGRGAFLRLASIDGWVLDFVDGQQTLRRQTQSGHSSPTKGVAEGGSFAVSESVEEEEVKFSVSLASSLGPRTGDSSLGEPEVGEWRYVVLDPQGITLRSRPTYDKGTKLKSRLEEGELVTVLERRGGIDTRFLRVDAPGQAGWGFEQQPGEASVMRMMEVIVDEGSWVYQVVNDKGCALRGRCTTSMGSKTSAGPQKGAIVRIGQRVKVGSTTFLRLKDGCGWIFDKKGSKPIAEGPLEAQMMRNANATVIAEEGIQLLKSPTDEPWAKTKMVILCNAKVSAIVKLQIDGVSWMEITKPGGMTGWTPAAAIELENAVFSSPGWAR